jgi:hypothetical protein
MATLMQARIEALNQEPLDSESVVRAFQPWHRRLAVQQLLRWTTRGIAVGLLLACSVLLSARLTPWASALAWATGCALVCTLLTIGVAIWRRPSLARTARLVDARLSLHDRLSTAWELREQTTTLVRLQRRDALKQLQKHKPASTISLRPHRLGTLLFAVVVLACVLLIVLPNPMTALIKQQQAFQARIAKQVASIDKVRQTLDQQAGLSPQERQKIDQILSDLENKLQQSKNATQAQQAIAQAQAKLNQQGDPQATNMQQANAAASSALQGSNNANLKALGNALANNDSKQVSNDLQNLASQIGNMSAQQRSQLAQQLENAANQAGQQNPALSSALHQLAKAVTDGNKSEIADASNALQQATDQNAATQAKSSSINQASQSLQQAANSLASATDGSNSRTQVQGQQNQGQGQQGQGQGQQAQGQGQQQGQSQQGQGQGQGQQGQGHGGSGGTNGASNNQGKNEQVTIPGQTSSGSSTQSADNNTGVVQSGSTVPYSQVIAQYTQMAHDEIDSSNVSPDMKDLVHNYFNSLEGQ